MPQHPDCRGGLGRPANCGRSCWCIPCSDAMHGIEAGSVQPVTPLCAGGACWHVPPPLPPAKARAVSSLGFGCVDKLFISFPAAAAPLPAPSPAQAPPAASPAGPDHKELIRSYQLLWPQQDPAAFGPPQVGVGAYRSLV